MFQHLLLRYSAATTEIILVNGFSGSQGMREISDFFISLRPESVSSPFVLPLMIDPGGIVYRAHGIRYDVSLNEIPSRCASLSSGVVCWYFPAVVPTHITVQSVALNG